jgi:hypothetical protein
VDDERGRSPGRILVVIGVLVFAFVILANVLDWRLGPILGFFEDNLFLPVILIFVGRLINRRAKRQAAEPEQPPLTGRRPAPPPFPPLPGDYPTQPKAPPPKAAEPKSPAPAEEPVGPIAVPPKAHPTTSHTTPVVKTSAEMIAEAKRRMSEKRR